MLVLQDKLRGVFITLSARPTQCLRSYCFLASAIFEKLQNPLEQIRDKVESKKTKRQKNPHAIHLRHTVGIPQTPIHKECIVSV